MGNATGMYGGNTLAETASSRGDRLPLFLEMRGISKRFPGVAALNDVSFDIRSGEVHGLVGENGAGTSLIK
jgi:ABC-type sugar transport system ATPase subunit